MQQFILKHLTVIILSDLKWSNTKPQKQHPWFVSPSSIAATVQHVLKWRCTESVIMTSDITALCPLHNLHKWTTLHLHWVIMWSSELSDCWKRLSGSQQRSHSCLAQCSQNSLQPIHWGKKLKKERKPQCFYLFIFKSIKRLSMVLFGVYCRLHIYASHMTKEHHIHQFLCECQCTTGIMLSGPPCPECRCPSGMCTISLAVFNKGPDCPQDMIIAFGCKELNLASS